MWRHLKIRDGAAVAVLLISALFLFLRLAAITFIPPLALGLALLVSAAYLFFFRAVPWLREHWLWSLRSRLILAYLFIAVVPMLLLASMAALSAYFLYWHFGAYLVYADFQKRIDQTLETAETLSTAYALEAVANGGHVDANGLPPHTELFVGAAQAELPGLKIEVGKGEELLQRAQDRRHTQFAGLVQNDDMVAVRAVVARRMGNGRLIVSVSVPLSPEFAATIEPDFGPVQIGIMRPATSSKPQGFTFAENGKTFVRQAQIQAPNRSVPRPAHWFDYTVTGFEEFNAVNLSDVNPAADLPVIARFSTRSSRLNRRLFTVVGQWGGIAVDALLTVGAVFVVLELIALAAGIRLTRKITHTVDDLYHATEYVRSGDLTHRVRITKRDQLGALGESFNSMTASISTLIEEQRQRQRLQHELAIASEVQAQLFPRQKPHVQGVEFDGICLPARIVSGDYYDFMGLGPSRLGIALADISGKGISAALIMASLQAALRSLADFDRQTQISTAEIVKRLNRHLFRSTSNERFATLFFGIYDAETRQFRYTNAGHPPPLFVRGGEIKRLETGGTVIGLFEDREYEQEILEVGAGDLLIAYSDGLTESEDASGEEFGDKRLMDLVLQSPDASPHALIKRIVSTAETWSGSTEQSDDLTVIAARF